MAKLTLILEKIDNLVWGLPLIILIAANVKRKIKESL